MKFHLIALFVCGFISTSFSQVVNIPDFWFKNYLLNHPGINTNGDNEIQVSEAMSYTDSILCYNLGLQDLTGIEAFENLTYLGCVNNSIDFLDLSHNVALKELICVGNDLTALDLSHNVNLRDLRCAFNPIQTLDVSHNIHLEYLYCDGNGLSTLDLSNNPDLLELACYENALTSLDLSENPLLRYLDCSSNDLTQLTFPQTIALKEIRCQGNYLPGLALQNCPDLIQFGGTSNSFIQLDLSNCPDLERFDSPFTPLTSLDFSHNPNIKIIYCFSDQLTSLNVANGNNPAITRLWASNNHLDCIKVDDVAYSNANWVGNEFQFDSGDYFTESASCVLGLSDASKAEIRLNPNPATDFVRIELPSETKYRLCSVNGETLKSGVLQEGNQTFSIDGLSSGVYFFQFDAPGQNTAVYKLLKN